VFRSKIPDPNPKISINQGNLFIIIALTKLEGANGWFTILEGSHRQLRSTPESEWKKKDLVLFPGDAIIWRSDLATLESAGGGGKCINLHYKMAAE
jgi:ectoine hydroxylase-related dioxygenase (phytanoyl-CoA dioxygenase family)